MMSVAQVIVITAVQFILYRLLLKTIGIERLGIWSVVLATTSVAQIANLGLSAGVVKFVAKYLARGEEETVVAVIQTTVISLGLFFALILVVVYSVIGMLLGLVVPTAHLKEALSIVPFALLSLWITVLAGVYQAGLDGYQRIDLRSKLLMSVSVVNLIVCYVLVPKFGLMGLAYAQVAQSGLLLIGSGLVLKRRLPVLPLIPSRWNREVFREMLGYGLNFQVITISQMLCDPITKSLLSKFGGLSMTGFYEMAGRMVMQVRAMIVSANQVLTPAFADLEVRNPEMIRKLYKDSFRLILYVAVPSYAALIAFIPILSELWIGHYEKVFILFSVLLAAGSFVNTLAGPAYFVNLGTGELRWNTWAHVIIGVSNLALGWFFGGILGGKAVVIAWVFSLTAGSLVIPFSYHYKNKIPVVDLVSKENGRILLASLLGLFFSLLFYNQMNHRLAPLVLAALCVFFFSAILVVPIWLHPMRKRSMAWIADEFVQVRKVMAEK
jgi:O-antigen/teichoic acid export membrane protein